MITPPRHPPDFNVDFGCLEWICAPGKNALPVKCKADAKFRGGANTNNIALPHAADQLHGC